MIYNPVNEVNQSNFFRLILKKKYRGTFNLKVLILEIILAVLILEKYRVPVPRYFCKVPCPGMLVTHENHMIKMVVLIFGYQIIIEFEVILDGAEIEQLYISFICDKIRTF